MRTPALRLSERIHIKAPQKVTHFLDNYELSRSVMAVAVMVLLFEDAVNRTSEVDRWAATRDSKPQGTSTGRTTASRSSLTPHDRSVSGRNEAANGALRQRTRASYGRLPCKH